MVRRSLLGALVIAALGMSVHAQPQYIGCPDTNAASSASNNTYPMGSNAEWRYQYMLPASCFPGTPAAPYKIVDLAMAQHATFRTTHPGTYGQFQVRMAHTTLTALTNNFASNLGPCPVTVLNRPSFTWAHKPDTWVDFGLDCQFGYNGVDNIIIEIRYTGGNSASLPKRAENPAGGYRVYTRGPGTYNATTATSVLTTSLPKTRFTIDQNCVLLALTPQVSLGTTGAVQGVQATPSVPYQIASAFGHSTKIRFGGVNVCIDLDDLFKLSVSGNALFQNYGGNVAANGTYTGSFRVPRIQALIGLCLSHASITVNPNCASNTVSTEIVP